MKTFLETERLLLREYVEEDAEAFFKLNSDPEVLRFVPDQALLNVEQARQTLLDHPIADYRKHGFGRGACILKSTGEQIGFAGLKYLEEVGEVDVAYRLQRAYWGQGLATEGCRALVRAAFTDIGAPQAEGMVHIRCGDERWRCDWLTLRRTGARVQRAPVRRFSRWC